MTARAFTYRAAQSRTIVVAVTAILLIESTVLHLWIASRAPIVAWTLTVTSVATLLWFWRDDARYRAGAVQVDADNIGIAMGTRWLGLVPREVVASATRPSWQDVPAAGTPDAAEYVNLTKPADPNVLLVLHEPAMLRAFGLVTKRVRRIGLHLDAPDEFLQMMRD